MNGKGRVVFVGLCVGLASLSQASLLLTAFSRPQIALVAQSNLLIWNPNTKTEHLIQSSYFLSNTKWFAFVTPTPSVPVIEAATIEAFDLARKTLYPTWKPQKADQSVEVKQTVRLGKLEATTIKASDVIALADWMEKNGYKTSDEQKKWLEKYVQKRWYLTAFRYASEDKVLQTEPVRMSFKTEVPFNPYFGTSNSWLDGVRQELFLVSPVPLQGVVGAKQAWKAESKRHTFVTQKTMLSLTKTLNLPKGAIAEKSWMNQYIESGVGQTNVDDIFFYSVATKAKQ
jgi:hypothetical protein